MKPALACAAYAAASLGLHAWLLSASTSTASEHRRAEQPPLLVQLSEPEPPKPAPPLPEPKVEPPPPRAPAPVAKLKPAPPEPAPEKPPEAAPPELTGTTLTSDADSTWSAPAGSGNERDGLLRTGAVSAFVPPAPVIAAKASTPSATSQALVRPEPTPLAQLSRKPSPPPLADALERHYPVAARRLGRSGEALVRARIEANGLLSEAQLKSETAQGFGAACRQALLASRWTAPLDRDGRPVATYITYRCKFVSE